MTDALWRLGARQAVGLLKRGEITPAELLDAVLSRTMAVDACVNALPTICEARAREAIGRRRPDRLETTALAGLPVPVKDSYAVVGVRTTYGSRVFEHHVPDRSDFVVDALEAAGGIVFAKSNTPEFEAGANTFNEVFGATLNPWDLSRSAGGSSGGAAVAVATGMAAIAQGSDFACSLRYPAAFCGVSALRPSPGLVPQGPNGAPWQTLSVLGPIARTVADLGLGLAAMARFDPRDVLSRPIETPGYADAALSPRRPAGLVYSEDLGVAAIAPEVRAATAAALRRLEAAGAPVEIGGPDLRRADRAFRVLRAFQFAAARADLDKDDRRALLKPEVAWNIEQGLKLAAEDVASAERDRAHAREAMLSCLGQDRFLVAPAAPVAANPVEERFVGEIAGRRLATYLDWLILGYAVTVTGCPVVAIPCGRTEAGLPVGLQIVGRPYREAELLAVAAWCEAVLGEALEAPIDPRANAAGRRASGVQNAD